MKTKIFLILVFAILLAAFFLRVYRLPETLMFLSDQGRDAIVLKRLVTLEKMVFVGPTTSIGNVFTGPFYYYLVAPFMAIWMLNPVGPAYGVAIINIIGIALCTYFVFRLSGKNVAFVFLLFCAFSANQVMQSRFSWNPNPLPVFAFGSLLAFFAAQKTQKKTHFVIAGILLGISLQLHYIAFVLPFFVLGQIAVKKGFSINIAQLKRHLLGFAIVAFIALITFTPLILFEIKNGFINTKTLLRASSTGEVQAVNTTYPQRLADTAKGYLTHTFTLNIWDTYQALAITAILFALVAFVATRDKSDTSLFVRGLLVVIIVNILILSRLETGRHVHYYNPSYFASFFVCAYLLDRGLRLFVYRAWRAFVIFTFIVLFGIYMYRQIPNLEFLFEPTRTHTQLSHAEDVAKYIISQVDSPMYQVIGLPFYEVEGHYRYYLELLKKRPMPADALGDPKELFVICHELDKKDCDIPGNAQWQLADFQNRHPNWKFVKSATKQIDAVRIYKLVY